METTTNSDELKPIINQSSSEDEDDNDHEDDEVIEKIIRIANKKYFFKESFTTLEKANEYVSSEKMWKHAKIQVRKRGKNTFTVFTRK
jgi:hypothetical protein